MLNHTSVSALLFRAQLNHLSWDVNPSPNSHGLVEKIWSGVPPLTYDCGWAGNGARRWLSMRKNMSLVMQQSVRWPQFIKSCVLNLSYSTQQLPLGGRSIWRVWWCKRLVGMTWTWIEDDAIGNLVSWYYNLRRYDSPYSLDRVVHVWWDLFDKQLSNSSIHTQYCLIKIHWLIGICLSVRAMCRGHWE